MDRALNNDLRDRVLKDSEGGLSARKCAERIGVAASTTIRWIDRAGKGETTARKPARRVSRLDAHAFLIDPMIEDQMDIALDEMVVRLALERDVGIGRSMLSNWLRSRGFTYKKVRTCIGAGAPGIVEATPGLV